MKLLKTGEEQDEGLATTPSETTKLKHHGFHLSKQLSQGCSAKIFLSTFSRQGKPNLTMACKIIDKKSGDQKFVHKFLPREVAILAGLNSPYCIQVFSIIEIRSKCFIFMRHAEHGDLLDYLTNHGPLEESHARVWMRQLLLALSYLQNKSIAHRDIKCENILITANLNAKLADFGFARTWVDDQGTEVLSETYCGSISYAAPEILQGRPYVPKHCDVWSLGVVFFVMFNLSKPFTKNKTGPLLQQQLDRQYKFKPKVDKKLSHGVKAIIAKMLEPAVDSRGTPGMLLNTKWMKSDVQLMKFLPEPSNLPE